MLNNNNFERTALSHMPVLRNYAFYLTMNSENANDLLQDTYLKAYRFWDKFEEGTNIKAWLYQVMKNSYINSYRKGIKEPVKIKYEEYHLPYNTKQEMPFDQKVLLKKSYGDIFEDKIANSIDSLKDSFKTILILSDVEGFSYEEIAKIVKCPIGTVRSRLFRGRKQLKKKLFNYASKNGYISKGSQVKALC